MVRTQVVNYYDRLLHATFHPIGAGVGIWDLKNWKKIVKFRNKNASQVCIPCAKFSAFVESIKDG